MTKINAALFLPCLFVGVSTCFVNSLVSARDYTNKILLR